MKLSEVLIPIIVPYMIVRLLFNFEIQQAVQTALFCWILYFAIILLLKGSNK